MFDPIRVKFGGAGDIETGGLPKCMPTTRLVEHNGELHVDESFRQEDAAVLVGVALMHRETLRKDVQKKMAQSIPSWLKANY